MNLYNQKEFRHSLLEKKFTEEERKTLSKKGFALPDGSFPIENENDLENAIHAIGRAKDKEAAKKHIIKRAQALEKERLVPTSWLNESLTVEEESNLESRIKDIIQSEIYLRDVPYSMSEEKDMEVDPDSIDDAAKAILKEISPLLNSEIKEAKTDMSYRLSDDDKHNVDYEFSHIDQNLEPSEIVDKISDKLGINWFEVSAYLKHNGLKTKVNESNDGLKKIVLQIYPNGSKSNSYIEIDNNRKIVNTFFDPKEPHLYHESLEVGNTLDPDFESDEVSENKLNEDYEDIEIQLKNVDPSKGFGVLIGWVEEIKDQNLLTIRINNDNKTVSLNKESVKKLISDLQSIQSKLS